MMRSIHHRLWLLAGVIAAMLPANVLAHTRERPTPDDIWSAWNFDPYVTIGLLLGTWLYLRGVAALWRSAGEGAVICRSQRTAFLSAIGALIVALISPLDALGAALFSAHMVQHLLLFVVVPWLLAYARPTLAMWWALPRHQRVSVGQAVSSHGIFRALRRFSHHPLTVWMVFTGVLWVWHVPALYNAALRSDFLHAIEHISFMAGAFALWSWLMHVHMGYGRRTGSRHGLAILVVFSTVIQSGMLGAVLTFARTPFYDMHEPYTVAWGLSLLEDQQLAGLLMWIPMGLVFTLYTLVLFRAWLAASDREAERWESGSGATTRV